MRAARRAVEAAKEEEKGWNHRRKTIGALYPQVGFFLLTLSICRSLSIPYRGWAGNLEVLVPHSRVGYVVVRVAMYRCFFLHDTLCMHVRFGPFEYRRASVLVRSTNTGFRSCSHCSAVIVVLTDFEVQTGSEKIPRLLFLPVELHGM